MVYEVRCDNCGNLLEFGGSDPDDSDLAPGSKIPRNALEFDGSVYCEACLRKFVQKGIGDVDEKIEFLMDQMDEVREELGMEKHQEI